MQTTAAACPVCLITLQAKSSEEMGHWLGLLLSESGSKTDPEEFTYDYVDADRVSCIVSAAKNSFLYVTGNGLGLLGLLERKQARAGGCSPLVGGFCHGNR